MTKFWAKNIILSFLAPVLMAILSFILFGFGAIPGLLTKAGYYFVPAFYGFITVIIYFILGYFIFESRPTKLLNLLSVIIVPLLLTIISYFSERIGTFLSLIDYPYDAVFRSELNFFVPTELLTLISSLFMWLGIELQNSKKSLLYLTIPLITVLLLYFFYINGKLQFHNTVIYGTTEDLKKMIEQGYNANYSDKNGITPLMLASINGRAEDVDKINLLLSSGANPNIKDDKGETVLLKALETGNKDYIAQIANLLLDYGADINPETNGGITELMIYSATGDYAKVKEVINKDTNINATNINNKTALDLAIKNKQEDVIKILLNNDATIMNKDLSQATWLFSEGNVEIVKLLFEKNINFIDTGNSWTALMYAVENGHYEIVKTLIENGIDVNTTNGYGNINALKIALKEAGDFAYLVREGQNQDPNNKAYLDISIYLINKGAKMDDEDKKELERIYYDYLEQTKELDNYKQELKAIIDGL